MAEVNEYKENTRSYCSRIQADCGQIQYLANLILFSETADQRKHHIESLEEYLKKIKEHLIALDKLE